MTTAAKMTDAALKLQYQLSNGNWMDCVDDSHAERYLGCCVSATGLTRNEVIRQLAAGEEVRNDRADWYSNCRSGAVYEQQLATARAAQKPVELVKCTCGCTVPKSDVMHASMGTSCPDCYDRMSD